MLSGESPLIEWRIKRRRLYAIGTCSAKRAAPVVKPARRSDRCVNVAAAFRLTPLR
jgi:hypothetical protein